MRVIYFVILALLLGSCATRKERAVRHVNKALRLDPQVLTEFNTPIRLDTTIYLDTTIVTPERKIYLEANQDSIEKALEARIGVKSLLVENSKLKLELIRTKEGWLEFLATVKPDTIPFYDTIPIFIEKQVPVKGFPKTVYVRGYWYYSGIVFNVLAVIVILFLLWRLFRK